MRTKWTQRDGTKIRIRDMTPRHLENAARMVLRRCESETLALGNLAFMFHGEMASYYAEREYNELLRLDGSDLVSQVFGDDSEAYAVVVAWERYAESVRLGSRTDF